MSLERKEKKISDSVYFAFLTIVLIRHFLLNTMIDYKWINNIVLVISFAIGVCVVIKILAEWKGSWGCSDIATAIITVGFIATSNFFIRHSFVWEYLLLILGARNLEPKKIIKSYLLVTTPLFLATVAASQLGIIENLVFYRSETSDVARYAMGFLYVTDFCAHLFFLCAAYAFYRAEKISYIEILCIGFVGVLCYVLSEGRNSTICIFILVLILLFSKLIKGLSNGEKKIKLFNVLLPLFMPIAAGVSILIAKIYNPIFEFFAILNRLMGHRPEMDAEAFDRYKVTLFGQNFKQTVFGGTSGVGFPKNYFFIDCSYVSILLRMGLLALIGILVMWFLITYRECKKGHYNAALILCVVAFHCFMEKNILNISYNPFLLLAFAGGALEYVRIPKLYKKLKAKWNIKVIKNCLSLVIFAVVVEVLAFNMQSLTSAFKSYTNVNDYSTVMYGVSTNDYNMYENVDTTYIKIDNVDNGVESMNITLNLYSTVERKLLYNERYAYVVLGYDEEVDDYIELKTVNVNTGDPASGYVKFDKEYNYNSYVIGFGFNDKYQFEINGITINGPKPFHISYLRLLIIYLVLVIVYYFGIERRNAEVKPETVEVQKATSQFESTGALRTEAHKNIRAVYDKKNPLYIFIKRAFDILASGIAIIILSPIFIITAIAIKIEDKGPVFFVQMRAGKNLKPFKMWKFRSMYVNADEKLKEMLATNEQTGHAFKIKNDPRITKVGKFIRKFSIDELPQLFNVFLGDMSVVGPRPILVFQMEECDEYDRQRLIVQPGLTCIWQVSGRANIKWDKWVELDLDYIDKMSIWTDVKLICLTIPCVLSGDGAY